MVIKDVLLIILIVLLIIVVFSFDYHARANRKGIRLFFEDYDFLKNGIWQLAKEFFQFKISKNIIINLVGKVDKNFIQNTNS